MTDRPNHRAAAERMLADADEWTAQAEEPTPEVGELSCLAYAAVHALLAIHDTLTAADRYAANEARQREEAEPDPLDPSMAECSRCGELYAGTAEATMEHHRACTGETPENPMGDPLDEDDHRDRMDRDGMRLFRVGPHHWHPSSGKLCVRGCDGLSLASWNCSYGPLAFAPDADGAPSVTAPAADDPADDAVDGEEGERRYLNAQTGRERARLTAQLRRVISSVQDSGDLAELDALADEWEANTDG